MQTTVDKIYNDLKGLSTSQIHATAKGRDSINAGGRWFVNLFQSKLIHLEEQMAKE